jgi:hypothetical protein
MPHHVVVTINMMRETHGKAESELDKRKKSPSDSFTIVNTNECILILDVSEGVKVHSMNKHNMTLSVQSFVT